VSNNRQPYILITLYQNLYKQKYGQEIRVNKFREKWAMQDVLLREATKKMVEGESK